VGNWRKDLTSQLLAKKGGVRLSWLKFLSRVGEELKDLRSQSRNPYRMAGAFVSALIADSCMDRTGEVVLSDPVAIWAKVFNSCD